jgi:proline dehydrogenase
MIGAVSRATFSSLAGSRTLRMVASRYGMRKPHSFARRFVAGETLDEAIAAARKIETLGMTVTLDHLGEAVSSSAAAIGAARDYMAIVEAIAQAGITRNISVKLTQLGLTVDRATAVDNMRRVLDTATRLECFVRIDMEGSAYTEQTFEVFDTLWDLGARNIGVVIQSYLRRSPGDLRRMNERGARVRLVKGAYQEPREIAFAEKADVDAAYIALMETLFRHGTYPAIATHDPAMIAHARAFTARHGIDRRAFEFQMLYGIRRDLQRRLVSEGYTVRVYVPYGTEWFPYFMRRLGERPANVGFVARSLLKEEVY